MVKNHLQWRRPGFSPWVGKMPWRKGMAIHSSILAWRILWTEKAGKLQSVRLYGVRHNWAANTHTQLCPTLCDPMDHSMPGFPVHHQLLKLAQTHVYEVGDAIQPSHPLSSPSPPALNPSQHQGLFQWVSSSHQVAKVLEFQLQHQSFQWIFRTDFLWDWLVWSPCSPRDSR